MFNFLRKNKVQPDIQVPTPVTSRVEIELAKGANKEAAEKAKQVNTHVEELLVQNGFTLKIYLAAGGQLHKKTKKSSGVSR